MYVDEKFVDFQERLKVAKPTLAWTIADCDDDHEVVAINVYVDKTNVACTMWTQKRFNDLHEYNVREYEAELMTALAKRDFDMGLFNLLHIPTLEQVFS